MTGIVAHLKGKTYKRETAWFLLSVMCLVILGGDIEMVKAIIYPIMMFAGLAFGLDWKSKQG